MKKLREEYLKYLKSDMSLAANDMQNAKDYIKNSTATFTRGALSMVAVPKMYTRQSFEIIKEALQKAHRILDKLIERYLVDKKLRQLFGFDDKLNNLILLKKQYEQNLPICRLDIFFDEDKYHFKFCEFNADGSSAMNEDREIYNAWKDSSLYQKMSKDHTIYSFELFDSWVEEFLSLYQEFVTKKELEQKKPVVAIVDFLEIGTKSEFVVFRDAFEKKGCKCVIEDITRLKYDGKNLLNSDGLAIDAVYRRAVTSECLDKYDQIQPFLQAVIEDNVCLIGAFRTQIIHDKKFFCILRNPYVSKLLTKDERKFIDMHIPQTYMLNDGCFDKISVLNDKDRWIMKPSNRYASIDVYAGGDYGNLEWYEMIKKYENKDFVLQEYCTPYRAENMYFDDLGNPKFDRYGYMCGVFLYNGKVCGLYSRCMLNRTTTQADEGRVACSLILEKKT